MADLPILFSAPMVRALISGTKTQTRRTIGRLRRFGPVREFGISDTPGYAWHFRDKSGRWHDLRGGELLDFLPYKVGDRLYVREHWRTTKVIDTVAPRGLKATETSDVPYTPIRYEADGLKTDYHPHDDPPFGKHRQAMHMPKWASRITLIVEGVKVERLQDISEEDAIAEGIEYNPRLDPVGQCKWRHYGKDSTGIYPPSASYGTLWDSINGVGSWDADPWVVAYTFRGIMGNIDSLPVAA